MAAVRSKSPTGATPSRKAMASLGLTADDVLDLVSVLRSGLPYSRLATLSSETGLSVAEISAVLGIPPRTLARRKAHGTLTGVESERLARLANLFDKASELFEGDVRAALAWLRAPAKALGNRPPLEMAQTEVGARAVEDLIGRLEFGVYS